MQSAGGNGFERSGVANGGVRVYRDIGFALIAVQKREQVGACQGLVGGEGGRRGSGGDTGGRQPSNGGVLPTSEHIIEGMRPGCRLTC